jgi:hypothetical protein
MLACKYGQLQAAQVSLAECSAGLLRTQRPGIGPLPAIH